MGEGTILENAQELHNRFVEQLRDGARARGTVTVTRESVEETMRCLDAGGTILKAKDAELESLKAQRDLYQGCCTRAFDEWHKLHPEAKPWPDGAVQLIELLKAEDGQLAALREALEKQPTPGPWSGGPESAHNRVGCSSCREWRGTWAEGETRTIEELLIAEDWHKEYCPWLVRHRALADGAGKPQAAVIAAAVTFIKDRHCLGKACFNCSENIKDACPAKDLKAAVEAVK